MRRMAPKKALHFRTIDLGPKLDAKLNVRYVGGVDEKEKGRKKRQEAFATQVRVGVNEMHVRLKKIELTFMKLIVPFHFRPSEFSGILQGEGCRSRLPNT